MRILLNIPLYTDEICVALNATPHINNTKISAISTDSRNISPNDLFIPLTGKNFAGEDFVSTAKSKGAITISSLGKGDILVKSDINILLKLANLYQSKLKKLKDIIAVTGIFGKTTTKDFLYKILKQICVCHESPENYNNYIGVALSILSAPADTEIIILEVGMNHTGEIFEISEYIRPSIGIITNIGTAHIGNLGSRKNIAKAKLEIKCGLSKCLIVPYDEPLLGGEGDITYSTKSKLANIYLDICKIEDSIYNCQLYVNRVRTSISFNTEALHLTECAACAISALYAIGITEKTSNLDFSSIFNENIRQNVSSVGDFYVMEDFYNASFESFKSGFEHVKNQKNYPYHSVLIGDILELGEFQSDIHRSVGLLAARHKFRKIYIFGKSSKFVRDGALAGGATPNDIFVNEDIDDPQNTAYSITNNHLPGEIIYFKASNAIGLGRILDLLKKN